MKYILSLIFIIVLGCFSYGSFIIAENELLGNKLIGSAVVGLFLVWMPLFIFHRYKNKNIKKYMITDDTIKKIKEEAENFLD